MGYGTRKGNRISGDIRTFWPDDTSTDLYIPADMGYTFQDVLDAAKEKWPTAEAKDISIAAEHIHTDCIGYDLYDAGDYTNFIHIMWTEPSGEN